MAITKSPLSTAANNIVSMSIRSENSLPRAKTEFQEFARFLEIKKLQLEKDKLPDKRKVRTLANINIVSNFGSAGNLLSNLLNGALDLGNFISGFFPGKGEKVGKPSTKTKAQPIPKISGGKLRLGGLRALGITNAIFSGLDFATGLTEGEGVGKAGAGALGSFGGAIAGSLLAGAVGQALVPVPGVGFILGMLGGAAGGFLGGYGADRAYEAVTGEVKEKQEIRLKTQEQKQKLSAEKIERGGDNFNEILSKFNDAVSRFEGFVTNIGSIMGSAYSGDEEIQEYGEYPERESGDFQEGVMPDITAEGGILPSGKMNSGYRTSRRPNHMGTDYAMPTGTPISVIQPGTVTRAGWFDGYGYGVQVNHPGGVNSFYGHLSSINVKVGQTIDPGTVIGKVGSTGRSTGPHLHFEVDANGRSKVDPTNYADKLFRFGGNIRTKSKTASPIQPSSKPPSTQNSSQQEVSTKPPSSPSRQIAQTTTPENIKPQEFSFPTNMVASAPRQEPKIQMYPSYSEGQSYIIEKQTFISSLDPSAGQSGPSIIPVGSGSGGPNINITPQVEGQVLNSLMKSILLTSLSSA